MTDAPIAITLDTDWAPDGVIDDALSIFAERGIRTTVFFTGPMASSASHWDETAVHPNLENCRGPVEARREIERLCDQFPEATGIRTHANYTNSRLLECYEDLGLTYESNYVCIGQDVQPFWMSTNVVQLPIYFMDSTCLVDRLFGSLVRRTIGDPLHRVSPLVDGSVWPRVFVFHPVHIFANTMNAEHYATLKSGYHDPDYLLAHRGAGRGMRDLVVDLADCIVARGVPTATMSELREWTFNGRIVA